MRTKSKTIFSSLPAQITKKIETQKSDYWPKKIFLQAKTKIKTQSAPMSSSPILTAKAEVSRQAVEQVINNSNRVLLKISSVFPWDIFPSKIVVEDARLVVVHRQLFASQVHSVDIKDISNIFFDTGIIFAQLTIISDTFAQNQIIINRLWKNDAILARSVIEGLRSFIAHDIDTTSLQTKELVDKLKVLNATQNATGILK